MCEYKDNFLMGPKTALESGEWLNGFCFASNAADDDLAQLAALVGSQSKLQSDDADEKIALAESAPALEFDLEEELARAFETNETAPEPAFTAPEIGVAYDGEVDHAGLSDTLQAQMESAAMLSPSHEEPADSLGGVDFSDMIAQELDKALAEEAAADAALDQPTARPAFPTDDIEQELSKLMGHSVLGERNAGPATSEMDPAPEIDAIAPPPMPREVVEPWQSAQVVTDFPAHDLPPVEPAATSHSEYTPVQMSDFEPEPAQADASNDVSQPVSEPENDGRIAAVLGGAAALAAAAKSTSAPAPQQADVQPQLDVDLADQDADLRLRLDELDYEHDRDKRRAGRRAAFAIVAVALLGGTAALAWNFVSGPTGETPTLLASTEPVKVKPIDAGGKVVPNQDQAVYQAVGANDQSASKQQRLTDDKEQPITVAVAPSGQKTNARVDSSQGDTTPLVLKPRSVRTVVVRPDGTIVSSGEPTVQRRAVSTSTVTAPALSLQNQVQNQLNTGAGGEVEQPLRTAAIAAPREVSTVPVTNLRTTEAAPAAAAAAAANAVDTAATAAAAPAATKPVEVAAATPKPAASTELPQVSSPYAVQVSSQRSAEGAKRSYATLSRRYASILQGRGVDYRQVEVKGKNYVRVRIPAKDRSTANQICNQLKSAGGDCFVTR